MSYSPGHWVVDDGVDSIDNMICCLKGSPGTPDEWVAVRIQAHDGYAETVAYCHPDNARLVAAVPKLFAACMAVLAAWESGDLAQAARM